MNQKIMLLVDDHQEFRAMLRAFIEKHFKGVDIIEAATGQEGLQIAIRERPQIALIDIHLPMIDGIQTAGQIKRHVPECRIITMSMYKQYGQEKFVTEEVLSFIEKDEIDKGLVPLLHTLLKS